MNVSATSTQLKIASIASLIAVLALVCFSSLWDQLEISMSSVLNNPTAFEHAEMESFLARVGWIYVADGIFIIGWAGSWLGLYLVARKHHAAIARLSLIFGLAGCVLDFTENEIAWSLLNSSIDTRTPAPSSMISLHGVVTQMSYWLPFLGAFFFAFTGYLASTLFRVMAVLGSVGVLFAVPGLYLPRFSFISTLWFGAWFAMAFGALWRESRILKDG